jgi:hypothetical protein
VGQPGPAYRLVSLVLIHCGLRISDALRPAATSARPDPHRLLKLAILCLPGPPPRPACGHHRLWGGVGVLRPGGQDPHSGEHARDRGPGAPGRFPFQPSLRRVRAGTRFRDRPSPGRSASPAWSRWCRSSAAASSPASRSPAWPTRSAKARPGASVRHARPNIADALALQPAVSPKTAAARPASSTGTLRLLRKMRDALDRGAGSRHHHSTPTLIYPTLVPCDWRQRPHHSARRHGGVLTKMCNDDEEGPR